MFNNRMLAVAAVLVMAVPALGAATPIVVPPVPEQLVEGHTVFTVIEIVRQTATNETRFAAAVAVLVREYNDQQRNQRFPGVLWFNDQYLVNPEQQNAAVNNFRYPCGGAVLAVNAGDPDPRMVIARVYQGTPGLQVDVPAPVDGVTGDIDEPASGPGPEVATYGYDEHTYSQNDYWVKPTPGRYYYGQDSGGPGDPETDYAWIGVTPGEGTVNVSSSPHVAGRLGYSDTMLTSGIDYEESYLITDPNDHSWIIDLYNFYHRRDLPNGQSQIYAWKVWAVNILGNPVFMVDDERTGCAPFIDVIGTVSATRASGSPSPVINNGAAFRDNPPAGYQQPSRNGYCYGGQNASEGCHYNAATGGPWGNCYYNTHRTQGGPLAPRQDRCVNGPEGPAYVNTPQRLYNALLYFRLEDLHVKGATRDHSDPYASGDTNGCAAEQVWWGPNPPQAAYDWHCPGGGPTTGTPGDDNAEGNSHSFHPTTPPHRHENDGNDVYPCNQPGTNPTNHGGSAQFDPYPGPAGSPADTRPKWYAGPYYCDYEHATRNIDIYFNGGGRPFPPVVRNFWLTDLEGSAAPFHDYHCAYGESTCPSASPS